MLKIRKTPLYAFGFTIVVVIFFAGMVKYISFDSLMSVYKKYGTGKIYFSFPFAKRDELKETKKSFTYLYETKDELTDPFNYTDYNSIYFLETSETSSLNPRQACSIESAARANPTKSVVVIVTGKERLSEQPWVSEIQKLRNVYVELSNMSDLFQGTPLQRWYDEGVWWLSPYQIYHLSDALRLVTVWQRGGIYLDLDFMVLHPFDDDFSNVLMLEHSKSITNSIFSFQKGDEFLLQCIKNLETNYTPEQFAANGPHLITRCFLKSCNDSLLVGYSRRCNVTLLPYIAAFPIPYERWPQLFAPTSVTDIFTYFNDSYAVHIFNFVSHGTQISPLSLYDMLMKTLCPGVYSIVGNTS